MTSSLAIQERCPKLHGFHDNCLLAPDTEISIQVTLRFAFKPNDSLVEPDHYTVTVSLISVTVSATGLASQSIADGVKDAIVSAFTEPRAVGDSFENGVVTTGQGVSIDVFWIAYHCGGWIVSSPQSLAARGRRRS